MIPQCQRLPYSVILAGEILSAIFGFIGLTNIILIIIILKNKSLRSNIYFYIINNNATSVLFLCVTVLDAIYIYYEEYPFNNHVLNFHTYIWEAILHSNVISLICITYEKYIAVFYPMRYVNSMKKTSIKIAVIWIISLILAIPFIFAYTINANECTSKFPFYNQNGENYARIIYTLQSIFLFFTPMIFTTTVYTKIIIWKKKSDAQQTNSDNENQNKELKNMIKMAIIMVLYFFIFWTPFILTRWIYFFDAEFSSVMRRFSQMFLLLYPAFSAIVYSLTNRSLKNAVKEFFNIENNC